MRQITETGRNLIKGFESFEPDFYLDPAGVRTIGFGHTGPLPEGFKAPLTPNEAERLLSFDLVGFEYFVDDSVEVPLTDNQYSALVSFCFNVGEGAFQDSTLLKLLNAGRYREAADQLPRWCKARDPKTGKLIVLPGLVNRRAAERALFLTPDMDARLKMAKAAPPEPLPPERPDTEGVDELDEHGNLH